MTAQEYLEIRLRSLKDAVNNADDSSNHDVTTRIRAKLLSKKFRKLKATPACLEAVDSVVKRAIDTKSPIVLSTLFGGNKLWRFEEAPEVDWAELFNLFYYIEWAKTIAAVHKPGVVLDYYSQDISVESLNNVPRSETDRYSITYLAMIEWLKPYMPNGIQIRYRRHFEDFADPSTYYEELEVAKAQILKENDGYPHMTDAMRTATMLNVRLKPGQDADPLWQEKVELEHQAIFLTPTLGKLFAEPDRISLSPTDYEDSNSIITGSTKRSYAKFWAGVGALEKSENGFNELVLTPKQLESATFGWQEVALAGLSGKNFSKVRVLK